MARGRPRSESASECEEKRKERQRKYYARKKLRKLACDCNEWEDIDDGDLNKAGRPCLSEGDKEMKERREKWREMAKIRKEIGPQARGRPRKRDENTTAERRREQRRESDQRRKERILKVKMNFPSCSENSASANTGVEDADNHPETVQTPPPILKSPAKVKMCYLD